ncbi:MAG: hypothetical protein QG657_5606, partial [Acidobacteriota bacterium]|nr:hypothetical protein [Acidobacteriota bacterium]
MKNRTSADKLAVIANQKTLEKKYWLEQLAGFTEKSNFPFDLSGENITNDRLETATSRLQGDLFLQLGKISKNSDIKLYMVLATGLAVLLRKYTSSNDIAIGTPIYKQESDSDFINTVLVLRNRFEDTLTFKELLLQVRNSINCAVENQNYPIDYLVEHLRVSHRENEYPFFDIGIFLQNVHYKKYFADIRFHMLFDFNRADDCLEVTVEYNPSLYRLQTVEQIIRHFNRLLETALANVDTPLSDIDVLSAEEKERLLFEFNGREEEYPCDKTFHGLFEEQVEQTPDRIAVIGFGSTVESLRAPSLPISP